MKPISLQALHNIRLAKYNNESTLDLCSMGLTALPEEIGNRDQERRQPGHPGDGPAARCGRPLATGRGGLRQNGQGRAADRRGHRTVESRTTSLRSLGPNRRAAARHRRRRTRRRPARTPHHGFVAVPFLGRITETNQSKF